MNTTLLSRVLQAIEQFPALYDPRWYREEHRDGRVTFDLAGMVALVEGVDWCAGDLGDSYVVGADGEPVAVERWAAERLGLDEDSSRTFRLCDDEGALPYFRSLLAA